MRPRTPGRVTMYTCGPTVYRYAHIGNLRTFLLADLVRRALEAGGTEVRQVQNITDVGHMTNEEFDRGEDRMLVQARLEDRSPAEIAAYYTEAYLADAAAFNLSRRPATPGPPTTCPRCRSWWPSCWSAATPTRSTATCTSRSSRSRATAACRATPSTSCGPATGRRAGPAQAPPRRLRPVEGGRAGPDRQVAVALGRRLPGLAHRVLGHVPGHPGRAHRPSTPAARTTSPTTRTRSPSPRRWSATRW